MGPPPRPPPVLTLQSPEELEHWVQDRPKTLLVIDVHPEWCGPCSDVLEGFYRKAALEANDGGDADSTGKDGGEEAAAGPALQFLTASRQLLGPKLRALLFPAPPQKEGQGQPQPQPQSSASKQPAWTASVQVGLDDGSGSGGGGAAAVGGLLESGGCQPLFVFVKGRQLVGVVRGVDTPAMLQQIQQHTGAGVGGVTGPGAA